MSAEEQRIVELEVEVETLREQLRVALRDKENLLTRIRETSAAAVILGEVKS